VRKLGKRLEIKKEENKQDTRFSPVCLCVEVHRALERCSKNTPNKFPQANILWPISGHSLPIFVIFCTDFNTSTG